MNQFELLLDEITKKCAVKDSPTRVYLGNNEGAIIESSSELYELKKVSEVSEIRVRPTILGLKIYNVDSESHIEVM